MPPAGASKASPHFSAPEGASLRALDTYEGGRSWPGLLHWVSNLDSGEPPSGPRQQLGTVPVRQASSIPVVSAGDVRQEYRFSTINQMIGGKNSFSGLTFKFSTRFGVIAWIVVSDSRLRLSGIHHGTYFRIILLPSH